jgi:hypothetical protein
MCLKARVFVIAVIEKQIVINQFTNESTKEKREV